MTGQHIFEKILCRRSNSWKFKFRLIFPCSIIPDAVKHPPSHSRPFYRECVFSFFGPPSRDPISLVLPKEDYYYSVGVVQYTPKKTVESNVISRHKTTQTILASIFLNLETTVIGNRHVIAYSSAYNALPSISHLRASNNMDAHLPFANNRRKMRVLQDDRS